MSGIAGIIHFDGRPVELGLIEKMTGAMEYRGPDGINHWVKGSAAVGHCMLRTTPESLEEHQPLANEDESLVLVMDGRVDNWVELREDLLGKGAHLRDRSDAELVLRAYEIWGSECLQHIDGDFALVVWDDSRKEVYCGRDRMGKKPFNYHWDGKSFVFASEIHAILLLPWVPEIINESMLVQILASEWHTKEGTLWKNVRRLEASCQMRTGQDGLQIKKYWAPDFARTCSFKSNSDYVDHYRELFFDTVRRLSRSSVPVACEVSGGLDSSSVFCVAEKLRRSEKLPAPAVNGFTLSFLHDKHANEREYSLAIADYLGVQVLEVPPTRVALSWYKEWASHYREFPGYPNGTMFLELHQAAIDQGCNVMLRGLGGDEWLGTENRHYYAEEFVARNWRNLYNCYLSDLREAGLSTSMLWALRYGIVPVLPEGLIDLLRAARSIFFRDGDEKRLADARWLTELMRTLLEKQKEAQTSHSYGEVKRVGQYRQQAILKDPYRSFAEELDERMASRVGLELRCPMQTPQMVEFALATPERLRIRGLTNRFLHVQAMQDLLPPKVLERKTKAEFSILIREHLDPNEHKLTHDIPRKRAQWINHERIGSVYECYRERTLTGEFSSGGRAQWILWNILMCDLLVDEVS